MPNPKIELREIQKQFPGVLALDRVNLDLFSGKIHALMGENGAGKSSLIKVLTGLYSPDSGQILVDGAEIHPKSPADAVKLGISTVYQEVNLAPNLSVAENIGLGREPRGLTGIRWKELHRKAEAALAKVGLDVDPEMQLRNCSIAVQQMVAIARALDVQAHTLILDEPTSSLDQKEVETLFSLMRSLRDQGLAVVFVTHFLDQVYAVSDRITVLRNGRKVGTWAAQDLPRLSLVSEMIGREISESTHQRSSETLSQSNESWISADSIGHNSGVQDVSFDLKKGSILGFAGLLGSGRTETLKMLFGVDSVDAGNLKFKGQPIEKLTPRKAIRRNLGYTTEDRKVEGILPELSVRENMIITQQAKQGALKRISPAKQSQLVQEMIAKLKIAVASPETPIQNLSGGNQQKVLLARWLIANPDVLLLDEPTRGIDVGAKFEILSLMNELKANGMSFVFVSSELNELVEACDQVLVFRDRQMVGQLVASDVNEQRIVEAIAEGKP